MEVRGSAAHVLLQSHVLQWPRASASDEVPPPLFPSCHSMTTKQGSESLAAGRCEGGGRGAGHRCFLRKGRWSPALTGSGGVSSCRSVVHVLAAAVRGRGGLPWPGAPGGAAPPPTAPPSGPAAAPPAPAPPPAPPAARHAATCCGQRAPLPPPHAGPGTLGAGAGHCTGTHAIWH